MGAEQDDTYAARRAELEGRFRALPPAASPAYWQAVETDAAAKALPLDWNPDPPHSVEDRVETGAAAGSLPLEVLVRCFQERWQAGARADCERIFEAILRRVQTRIGIWSRHIARQAPAAHAQALAADLELECDVALWRELCEQDDTFLAEHFAHKLRRIEQHTAHLVMEREGLWQRPGVRTPTRVPGAETDRLEARRDEEQTPLSERLYDASAEDAFARVELESDVQALLESLPPEARSLLYDCFWSGLNRDEVAERYGVTDRTVRTRLSNIYAELRRLIAKAQEDPNG